jgi:hypothetical protein
LRSRVIERETCYPANCRGACFTAESTETARKPQMMQLSGFVGPR